MINCTMSLFSTQRLQNISWEPGALRMASSEKAQASPGLVPDCSMVVMEAMGKMATSEMGPG